MPAPFDWNAFLALAEALATETAGEAELRTAISRAYYAAHGIAVQQLIAKGAFAGRGRISHRVVWQAYKDHDHPRRQRLGLRGEQLKQLRVHADYPAVSPGNPRRAADAALRTARIILALLEEPRVEGSAERT